MKRYGIRAALLLLALAGLLFSCKKSVPPAPLSIAPDDSAVFSIVYADGDAAALDAASEMQRKLRTLGADLAVVSDAGEEGGHELLIGRTSRPLSAELEALVCAQTPDGGLGWGFLAGGGSLSIYATGQEGYDTAMKQLFEEHARDGALTVPGNICRLDSLSAGEYDTLKENARECGRLRDAIRAMNTENPGEITALLSPYAPPETAPRSGQHPRVLVTADSLSGIRAAMEAEEGRAAAAEFEALSDSDITGILPALSSSSETHNYDGKLLGAIEAKGLAYLLTGEELYGYQAIFALNNFIRTLDIRQMNDKYRAYGHAMFVAGEIYDWCHGLMTDEDRAHLVSAVEYRLCRDGKMEIGFPPSLQSPISSHGSEAQLLRDYLAFAIAIYDEYPDWWEYAGGRFYAEYVPFRDQYMCSGLSPQGAGLYGPYRHNFDLWAAYLVKTMSGEMPFSDDIEQVFLSYLGAELPQDKEIFPDGDYYGKNLGLIELGDANADTSCGELYSVCTAMLHSALFGSGTSRAAAKYYSHDFTVFTYSNNFLTASEYLIFSGGGRKTAESRHESLPTVLYNSSPVGLMISREAWDDPDSAAVWMKIGERTTANHEHQDAGSFQIYYKGILTGDSGCYSGYGSPHHYYYHQATIAHNSLLVYNPAMAAKNDGWYSGGQRNLAEAASPAVWEGDMYTTGAITGAAYALTDESGSRPVYAYLAGNITAAYSPASVEDAERRMLTLYTDREDCPVLFFVFDTITARSGDFRKSFLLHTPSEPMIDGNRVTVINGGGKLTLTSLLGGSITAFGGSGRNYLVNGKQLSTNVPGMDDGMWGRVEISPDTQNKTDVLLNVLVVSDADAEDLPAPSPVESETLCGAQIGSDAVLFVRSTDRAAQTLTADTAGDGTYTYTVSGVSAGCWRVSVDGVFCGEVQAKEEEGLLRFLAPTGRVELVPGSDILPDGCGRIVYKTNGGTLPDGTPAFYPLGEAMPLSGIVPEKSGAEFAGWFSSPEDTAPLTEIPPSQSGTLRLYARWLSPAVHEDFSEPLSAERQNASYNGLVMIGAYDGCRFVTESDTHGSCLLWERGTGTPNLSLPQSLADKLNGESSVTFTLTLSNAAGKTPLESLFRIRGCGGPADTVVLFSISKTGELLLGGYRGHTILTLSDEPQTVTVTMDFSASTVTAYGSDGETIDSVRFMAPSGTQTTLAWMETLTEYTFNWYASSSEKRDTDAIRVYRIFATGGSFLPLVAP